MGQTFCRTISEVLAALAPVPLDALVPCLSLLFSTPSIKLPGSHSSQIAMAGVQTGEDADFPRDAWDVLLTGSVANDPILADDNPLIAELLGFPGVPLVVALGVPGFEPKAWWTFRIFFIFSVRGGGRGSLRRRGGGGSVFD